MVQLKDFQVESIITAVELALVLHSHDTHSHYSAACFLLTLEACLHNHECAVHKERFISFIGSARAKQIFKKCNIYLFGIYLIFLLSPLGVLKRMPHPFKCVNQMLLSACSAVENISLLFCISHYLCSPHVPRSQTPGVFTPSRWLLLHRR